MRRLRLIVVTLVSAGALAGGATASAPGTEHLVISHTWHGTTFVDGLGSCPLFGATSTPWYVFRSVDLDDHINATYTLVSAPVWQMDSVGSVHGVIFGPDGTYTVAGGAVKEHRTGIDAPWYFSGTGHVTISGPAGTVVGDAVFQDLSEFPPPEFDLRFTSIKVCNLR